MAEIYRSVGENISIALTDLITVSVGSTLIVSLLQVANRNQYAYGSADVTVIWYNSSSGKSMAIAQGLSIPSKNSINLLEGKLVLLAGDKIKIQSSISDTLDIIMSYLEVTT
jgi:hypothetical protein